MISGISLTSCDTSVGVEASEADGLGKGEVTEVEQNRNSEITEISIGKVSFQVDVVHAEIFLEMCKRFHTVTNA